MALRRRSVLAAGGAWLCAPRVASAQAAPVAERLVQGGFLIGRTSPRAPLRLDGERVGKAGASGLYVIGFDRDAPPAASLEVGGVERGLAVAPVTYSVQRIDGLPPDQVAPQDPALLARIAAELARKQAALASREDSESFATGFVTPLPGALRTSAFGPQRVLNGVAKPPHYGVDLAAPAGTPIHAPAAGRVVMAEPDMHFEGGLTLIDHGQGLVSMYLHQSRLDVAAGQAVGQGQAIGAVGARGRATGPHLCWRMTWRGRHMDPSLMLRTAA